MLHYLQRHVRYIVIVAVMFTLAFVFVTPEILPDVFSAYRASSTEQVLPQSHERLANGPSLSRRLARSERTYQDMLQRRQNLIAKHGPNASQVLM